MHIESSKGNFHAQRERTASSVERIQGPWPPCSTQSESPRAGNVMEQGFLHSPSATRSFKGMENMTPPAWQDQALIYYGGAYHV